MVKQALDAGAFGLMVPHVDSAEEARQAVRAMRYPPEEGAAHPKPRGKLGWAPFTAARIWDIPVDAYTTRADLWPLDQGYSFLTVGIDVGLTHGVGKALEEVGRESSVAAPQP